MSRAGRHAHKTAQALWMSESAVVVDRDRRPAVFVIGATSPESADDLSDHIRPGEDARCHRAVRIASSSKFHFGRTQRGRGVGLQRRPDP